VLDDFGDPFFPEAAHFIGRKEWDYWTSPETVDSIGEARAAFAVGAERRLKAIESQLALFDDGDELVSGVTARASFGHTPGHMCFEVALGDERVLIVGDAIGNHHIAFARPDLPSGADQDPDQGAATRQALLAQLADTQMPFVGFHLPFPGVGRAERAAEGYRFVPMI
jgi:glyoxylase-like metal-dependent hydrolase (beta-lactamase superfamily II)